MKMASEQRDVSAEAAGGSVPQRQAGSRSKRESRAFEDVKLVFSQAQQAAARQLAEKHETALESLQGEWNVLKEEEESEQNALQLLLDQVRLAQNRLRLVEDKKQAVNEKIREEKKYADEYLEILAKLEDPFKTTAEQAMVRNIRVLPVQDS